MVRTRERLGVVIGEIAEARVPVDEEMALLGAVSDPKVAHVHSFGTLLLDSVVDDAGSSSVVGAHGCAWLRVAKFFESGANGFCFLAVVEEPTKFRFGTPCQ